MVYTTVETAAEPLWAALEAANHLLLVTHVNPDGDAIGSLVGFGRAMRQRGKRVTLVAPTPLPGVAAGLPDAADVQVYTQNPTLPADADLLVLLDTGNVSRIGPIYEREREYLAARSLIVIDHHVTNAGEGMINLIMTEAASTCEMVALLLRCWNVPIDVETATALLLGTLTDTQSFQTAHTTPRSLRVAADLLAVGGRLNEIVRLMLFSKPYAHAKALGLALSRLQREDAIIWTELTQAMQRETGADDEAGDEITAYLTRIAGARVSVLFKERRDGTVKISLRSVPGVDVAQIAQSFGGGGHREASGATLPMTLDEARPLVLQRIRAMLANQQQS